MLFYFKWQTQDAKVNPSHTVLCKSKQIKIGILSTTHQIRQNIMFVHCEQEALHTYSHSTYNIFWQFDSGKIFLVFMVLIYYF